MTQTIDVVFPISGGTVARDHGYPLYSALCAVVPDLHEAPWLAVHPLSGVTSDGSRLIPKPSACLTLRLPAERIPSVLPLAGRVLDVAGDKVSLGAPRVQALVPAASLDARLVVLKLTDVPLQKGNPSDAGEALAERYVAELKRQLAKLNIESAPQLMGRRSITVAGKRVVGYSVRVDGLSADQSLSLQVHGLGGKHRMGCGVFRPTRGR